MLVFTHEIVRSDAQSHFSIRDTTECLKKDNTFRAKESSKKAYCMQLIKLTRQNYPYHCLNLNLLLQFKLGIDSSLLQIVFVATQITCHQIYSDHQEALVLEHSSKDKV